MHPDIEAIAVSSCLRVQNLAAAVCMLKRTGTNLEVHLFFSEAIVYTSPTTLFGNN